MISTFTEAPRLSESAQPYISAFIMENETLWKKVLDVVKVSVSTANFSTWFSQTFVSGINQDNGRPIYYIGCPSSFVHETLEKRYFGLLQDALNQVTGEKNDLVFVIKQNGQKRLSTAPLFSEARDLANDLAKKAKIPTSFSFDNFAVSPANQLAWSAATAVSKSPGFAYNPLFIWGGVGVGKTHLAYATAREILSKFPDKKVLCSTGDEFIVGIIDAIRTKTTSDFKKKYRKVDVLVIDDIGFIAGKETVQDEFFHTFNEVTRNGGQIILTSDRPPYEIANLEDRLRSRFEAGLIIDIGPPDFELRVAIMLIKGKERGVDLSIEQAQQISEVITTARQLEGFLARLTSRLEHQNLPLQTLVEELLKSEGRIPNGATTRRSINPKDVVGTVCDHFSVNRKLLVGAGRKKTLVTPRHILMYLLRTELNLPYDEIGKILGGRDHTTIMHGVEKVTSQIANNEDLQVNILGIKSRLWGQ